MDCLENEYVCSVQKENNKGYYRLHTIWKTNGFNINITSEDGAWCGEMNQSDVEKMSSLLEMDASTYLNKCKKALTTHDGLEGMYYTIENGCFEWKKIIDEDQGIKKKMGLIKLQPTNFINNIQKFVSAALKCNKKLEAELSKNQKILQKNCDEIQELLNKLDEFINTKNIMENDLYSKFILLLNTKKNKIKELEDLLKYEKHKKVEKMNVDKSLQNPYEIDTDSDDSCEQNLKDKPTLLNKRLIKSLESEKTKIQKKKKKKENKEEKKEMSGPSNEDTIILSKIKNDSRNCTNEVLFNKNGSTHNMTQETEIPSTQEDILNYFYGS